MIYTPDYTLNVNGKEIHFLFTSYFYEKYCERRKIELDDLLKIVGKTITPKENQGEELANVSPLKVADYAHILLAAHQNYCIYQKITCTADESDAFAWIDSIGGIIGSSAQRLEVFKIFVAKLLNVDMGLLNATTEVVKEESEKNAEPPALNVSPGGDSTGLQPLRA